MSVTGAGLSRPSLRESWASYFVDQINKPNLQIAIIVRTGIIILATNIEEVQSLSSFSVVPFDRFIRGRSASAIIEVAP